MRLSTRVIALAIVFVALRAPIARAAGDNGNTSAGGSTSNGTVTVFASSAPVINSGSGGGRVCTWGWLTVGDITGLGPSETPLSAVQLAANAVTVKNGVEYRVYAVTCPDTGTHLRLVNPNRTARSLHAPLRDELSRLIQLPIPDINPAPEHDSYVNLGLWLAVQPATYPTITAEAGPAWISVTPTLATTTFDFGNGDHTICPGVGTPISNLDTIDQGPCGYTYTQAGDYRLGITTTWELPYTSSSGAGSLEPIEQTLIVDYRVKEIQTVGVGG